MFGRKKRQTSNPAFNYGVQPTPSAATAAASAFLKNQASSASLSAAAAAAALRARPTTPTSVADVQTKRMLRRTTSNSSYGSNGSGSARGPPGSQLERRGSVGSMTERTFRDPSPNRGSARPSVDLDAPPVPAIPKNMVWKPHRRTASMESPVTRVASPPPNLATGRGSSLGPTPSTGLQPQRRPAGQRLSSLSSVQELTGAERPPSRGSVNFSVNFSYPTSNRAMAQYGQRQLTSLEPKSQSLNQVFQKPNLVYDPNTRSFRPEAELLFLEQSIQDVANRPVKTKKRAIATQPVAGSHFADGTAGGRIKGTAVDAIQQRSIPEAPQAESTGEATLMAASPPRRKKKKVPTSQQSSEADSYASTGTSDGDSDTSERPSQFHTGTGILLSKKPSIVREDREMEEFEDDTSKVLGRQAALNRLEPPEARTVSPTPRASAGRGHGRGRASASAGYTQLRQQTRPASLPAHGLAESPKSTSEFPAIQDRDVETLKSQRVQSVSPIRTAHFMHSPEILAVRHDPPPRAVSPRKSALKNSGSPRGGSPAPEGLGRGHGASLTEISDASAALSDVPLVPKKKSVRVSFDDENTMVVGESAGQPQSDMPLSQSPPTKRSWLSSLGRGKKKVVSDYDDADDEIMKPRPALPSFGSIREKKNRDIEDRPLVSPTDPNPPPISLASPPSEQTKLLGQSSDHVVGGVLAHDQALKNTANISKSREPLPPQVTSVEGSGYNSDSSSTYSLNTDPSAIERSTSVKRGPEDGNAETYRALASPEPEHHDEPAIPAEKTNGNGSAHAPLIVNTAPIPPQIIPTVAITQATPTVERTETRNSWPNIPGGFPEGSSDSGLEDSQVSLVEHKPTDLTPAAIGIAEPEPITHETRGPLVGEVAALNHHHVAEQSGDSDHDSVYSDAAEDLSDLEGDGFMSLDAVVESPIVASTALAFGNTPPESPTSKAFKERDQKKTELSRKSSEPELDEGWGKAQEYWSGLTADKKREKELAALNDNDETSEEEVATPAPKPQKKVSLQAPDEKLAELQRAPKSNPVNNRVYQILPGAKADPNGMPSKVSSLQAPLQPSEGEHHMRKSMRSSGGSTRSAPQASPEEGHMRMTMRNSAAGVGSMRGSMRATSETPASLQPKASLQKKFRLSSYQAPVTEPHLAQDTKHIRNISAGAVLSTQVTKPVVQKPAPALRRSGSVDSDMSDSSFKRARRSTEGYNMKRSMRGPSSTTAPSGRPQSPEIPTSKTRSSRFSLRSLSPTGSAFRKSSNTSPVPPASMPMTMRGNRPAAPTLRGPPAQQKSTPSTRASGFGTSRPQSSSIRASRFNDSSDEEDSTPAFRSRFVDSSDEEDTPLPASRQLTTMRSKPVRTIPRQTGAVDGDSSDLPDTDEEKDNRNLRKQAKPTVKIAPHASTPTPVSAGAALTSGSLRRSGSGRDAMGVSPATVTTITGGRPEQKRRGSFMSILRRKKDPGSKVRKSDAESAARRDTPLERSRSEVMAVKRQDSNFSTSSSPKLQKRSTPTRMLSGESGVSRATGDENWPLSSPADEQDDEKGRISAEVPTTSGTTLSGFESIAKRPDLGDRRETATGMSAADGASISGTLGKKKKRFGMLRRAFRLDE